MTTSRDEFEKEIKRYAANREKVLREVELFRKELLKNFRVKMRKAESGIRNTLYNTEKEPEIYPVLSPHVADLSAKGKDELLVALSTAFLELSENDFSKKPLYKVMRNAEKRSGRNTETGDITKKVYDGMKGMDNPLNPQTNFDWSAKYEHTDNSVLVNELPASILPPREDTPPILGPFWHAMNSREDFNVDRNHDWSENDLILRIIHEMTHAFNQVQLQRRQGVNLVEDGRPASKALDEAVAGLTQYPFTGTAPDSDYSDRGIDQQLLKKFREMYREYCDTKLQENDRKETVSKMRAHALVTIEHIENGRDPVKAFKKNIKHD